VGRGALRNVLLSAYAVRSRGQRAESLGQQREVVNIRAATAIYDAGPRLKPGSDAAVSGKLAESDFCPGFFGQSGGWGVPWRGGILVAPDGFSAATIWIVSRENLSRARRQVRRPI